MTPNRKDSERRRRPPHSYKLSISDKLTHLAELQQLGIHELQLKECCKIFNKTFENL